MSLWNFLIGKYHDGGEDNAPLGLMSTHARAAVFVLCAGRGAPALTGNVCQGALIFIRLFFRA